MNGPAASSDLLDRSDRSMNERNNVKLIEYCRIVLE